MESLYASNESCLSIKCKQPVLVTNNQPGCARGCRVDRVLLSQPSPSSIPFANVLAIVCGMYLLYVECNSIVLLKIANYILRM